jgi:two-component system chemotaxis sensor kinase CheA
LEAYVGTSDEIVREFLVESYENLDQLDQGRVALEGHLGSRELLSRVFRTIHTIQGNLRLPGVRPAREPHARG